jgi:spore maturation protein SpmB
MRMCVVLQVLGQVLQVLGRMCVVLQVLSRIVVLQVLGLLQVLGQVLGLVLQVLGLGLGGAFTAHRCSATHQTLFSPKPGNPGASE